MFLHRESDSEVLVRQLPLFNIYNSVPTYTFSTQYAPRASVRSPLGQHSAWATGR
jgi:hypothetical protein